MFTFGYKSKFTSILRASAAIGIGLVMLFGNNAPVTVVKIIAAFLFAAGIVSVIHGIVKKDDGALPLMLTNAAVDMLLGLALFFFPQTLSNFIIYMIGIALILFGALQLIVLSGAMSLIGSGFSTLLLSILAIIGGVMLLFSPFGMRTMGIIAGCLLIFYGVSELISTWKVSRAREVYEIKFAAPAQSEDGTDGLDTSGVSGAKEVEYTKVEEDKAADEQ